MFRCAEFRQFTFWDRFLKKNAIKAKKKKSLFGLFNKIGHLENLNMKLFVSLIFNFHTLCCRSAQILRLERICSFYMYKKKKKKKKKDTFLIMLSALYFTVRPMSYPLAD